MRNPRLLFLAVWLTSWVASTPLGAQETAPTAGGSWLWRVVVFIISLPYTLYMVFVDGGRLHLLPAPLLGAAMCLWSFREWRRQGFWTPRIVHLMSVLALATIILINVDWVMAGGEMWTQRYVVIAVFGIFPYIVYLVFLGPKFLGRRRPVEPGAERGPETPSSILADMARAPSGMAPPPGGPVKGRSPIMTAFYVLIGGSVAMFVGVFGLMIAAAALRPASVARPEFEGLRNAEALVPMARGVLHGDPDAPLTIIEFGDYQCPACGAFARRFKPQVDSAFIDTGQANFVYFDLPLVSLHANAFLAARAARCAEDQGRYWEYHDELYRQQRQWSELAIPHDAFAEYAETVGLDVPDFSTCLAGDRHTDVVEANMELAGRLGIRSTPTHVITFRGEEMREVPEYTFEALLEAIEEATATGPAG